jgi:hypothetical protein
MERALRAVVVAVALAMSSSGVLAAGCSTEIQNRWSASVAVFNDYSQMRTRAINMQEQGDKKAACAVAQHMPRLLQVAKEYYPACNPLSADRDINYFSEQASRASKYLKENCGKGTRP